MIRLPARRWHGVKLLLVMALFGCASLPAGQFDSFELVDCELPGPVIRMGTSYASTGRARALRTTAQDCGLRGGYYAAPDLANYETALRVWLPPADAGDAKSQHYVGEIYAKGLGQAADTRRAASWYQRAADQGYAPAQTALAMMHERGEITGTPDPQAALALYRQAGGASEGLAFASEVSAREADIRQLQTQLQQLRDASANERDAARQRQSELQGEIRRLRARLQSAEASSDAAARAAAEHALAQAQAQLEQRQAEAQVAEARLAEHNEHLQRLQNNAASATPVANSLDLSIELLDPVPIAMRGLLTVRRASGAGAQQVAARIKGGTAATRAWINGKAITPDADGRVSALIELTAVATPVQIRAGSEQGAQARLDFLILREDAALPQARLSQGAAGFGKYHALVIGNANYRSWEPLGTPHEDARRVSDVLQTRYGFKVRTLIDATRADILRALAKLREELSEDDHLLVYYSGHGSWDKANLQGYWVPVDGDTDSVANHVSSNDITDQLSVMRSRQILVVADACFSGVLVRSVADTLDASGAGLPRSDWLAQQSAVTGRKVLSSGNIREVLDGGAGKHSIFAAAFLRALEQREAPFEARELYRDLAPAVERAAQGFGEQQEPQFGALRHAGHVGGDFVFVPSNSLRG